MPTAPSTHSIHTVQLRPCVTYKLDNKLVFSQAVNPFLSGALHALLLAFFFFNIGFLFILDIAMDNVDLTNFNI